jgi:hypothetical protein
MSAFSNDLASTDLWGPRAVDIRGTAEVLTDPQPLIRIDPEHAVSWGLQE